MPEFLIRTWAKRVLYDSLDYVITADTIEEAAIKLRRAQEEANKLDDTVRIWPGTRQPAARRSTYICPLDLNVVIDCSSGYRLMDADGITPVNDIDFVDKEDAELTPDDVILYNIDTSA